MQNEPDLHAVIRFKRTIEFPRFSMKAGERWGFVLGRKGLEQLAAIKSGNRFNFAGGQCLAEDVEVIYEGPGDLNYSIAAGYVPPRSSGQLGRHDWAIGAMSEDGIPVFVDDRQLSYRNSPEDAESYALEIIARLQADGDYRLNDKPAGFLPPPLPTAVGAAA